MRTLDRGLAVLEALAREPGQSLSGLAARVDLPASTVFRLLDTLGARGFITRSSGTGGYEIGLRAFEVGSAYAPRLRVYEPALPVMQDLARTMNESINLAVLDGAEAVYIGQAEGNRAVRMFTELGSRQPVYCTGVGKALLAWKPLEEVAQLLRGVPLRAVTPRTLTDLPTLLEELAAVRTAGYAVDREEREVGVRCLAAPIRDRGGAVVAALSISAPAARLQEEQLERVAAKITAAAQRVSERLGYRGRNRAGAEGFGGATME